MPEQQPDLFEQLWDFLSQILMPNWPDLIALIPLLLIGIIVLFFGYIVWLWRRAAERNRPRLPRRLPTGSAPPGVHMPGPSRWPFVLPIGLTLVFFALIMPSRDEAGEILLPFNVPLLLLGLAVTAIAGIGWLRDAMKEWRAAAAGDHQAAGVAHAQAAPALRHGPSAAAALPAGQSGAAVVQAWQPPPEPPPGVHMPGPSPWPFFAPIGITLVLFGLILSPALVIGGLALAVVAAGGWLLDASREWRSTEQVGHAVPVTRDPVKAWPRRLVPVFALVIVFSVAVALLPHAATWIGGLAPAEATPTPLAVPERPEIAAFDDTSFDRDELIVPAGRDFELVFHNADVGVPHNVEITQTPARDVELFRGEIFQGDDTRVYEVPALEEGDYYFLCSVHPNMNGTVLARAENGGGGGQPGSGAQPGGGSPAP